MPSYSVTVATGSQWLAGTDNHIQVTLVGSKRCSGQYLLDKVLHNDFEKGAVESYEVTTSEELGEIQLLILEKKKRMVQDDWYCKYLTVKAPSCEYHFPCYRWITSNKEIALRDGRANLPQNDKTEILQRYRRQELEERQKLFGWREWEPGFPLSMDVVHYKDLPLDVKFDFKKETDFILNYKEALTNLKLNQFVNMFTSSWTDFEDFKKIFVTISNTVSGKVMQHWQEDRLFGYQFLNGSNPVMISKCKEIPAKFQVTSEMVKSSLQRNLTLEEELQHGNIFIVDYKLLDGIPANTLDAHTVQYVAAPMCLLYKNIEQEIVPIAIQIHQKPGPDNPVFLPSDSNYDWLLAKIWVRSSDFHIHQTITHLLRTHLLTEVFAIAMYRNLPEVHPLFKLLVSHTRFTIAINAKARDQLIGKNGLFDKANAVGGGGHIVLLKKAMTDLTYESICFPQSIRMKGMESKEDVPNYFYRDDGLEVWKAITNFVKDVVCFYYDGDQAVREDTEVQAFVKDVFVNGLRNCKASGFPESIQTKEQLIEYATLIIFNASGQHAAINFGQMVRRVVPDTFLHGQDGFFALLLEGSPS
ncbi:polyunsaturated fatty acid 5-lipoxygenase-like isoform X2 [Ambystoma mexicanum]|uniref:polyunsaturated fatty acid 5-lipoxygenase-like isoform X2 n=1 Tax=Ambystoma mexicanum TaxID=8296 RepID=UPI0037E92D11